MIDVYVTGSSVDIGRQGENNARNIYFDLTDLTTDYGEGTATLVHMRPSDQAPYICETETDGSYLIWTPSSTDTAYAGAGKCELRWVVGETLAKSIIYTTTIAPSITGDSVIPDPYQSWYDALIEYIDEHGGGGGTSGVSSVNGMTGAVVIPTATTSVNGLMSSTDKSHLDTVYADYSSALTALGVI